MIIFQWKYFLIFFWILYLNKILFVDCKLKIKIFKEYESLIEGILYKNLLPIKYERLDVENEKKICLSLNYGNIHAISYPKKLDRESYFIKGYCIFNDCQECVLFIYLFLNDFNFFKFSYF